VLVGWHLQADDGFGRHVDDDTLDHRDVLVTDQRVFPGLEFRVELVTGRGTFRRFCAGPAGRWRSFWSRGPEKDAASECFQPALSVE